MARPLGRLGADLAQGSEVAAATKLSEWVPPPEFDGYVLGRLLGRGSMGSVYLATDTLLERPVALKFLDQLQAGGHERFLVEARAIARLQHPNVLAVYRVGEVGGRPYLASEFLRGRALSELPLPLGAMEVVRVGLMLARGLAAAHLRGVVHRDVKPANALMADDGEVKLLDFGLARLAGGAPEAGPPPLAPLPRLPLQEGHQTVAPDQTEPAAAPQQTLPPRPAPAPPSAPPTLALGSQLSVASQSLATGHHLTQAGSLLGTPAYMAPEVWRGEPAHFRSDQYSLGALLYELAWGRPPFHHSTLAGLRAAALAEAPAAPAPGEPIEAQLWAVIERCLQKDATRRFPSVDAVREALERLLPGGEEGQQPEGNPYRGLSAFEAEHRAFFFGRDADTRTLLERLRTEPFVLVAGASGVGKSSVCKAGVIPKVLAGAWGDGRAWARVAFVPGRRPVQALAAALAPVLRLDPEPLAHLIEHDWDQVGQSLRRAQQGHTGLLLFVDQLEELSTLSEPGEARVVATALSWLASFAPSLRLLCTARADLLDRVAALEPLGEQVGRALHLLRPLSAEGTREAIVGPARARGFEFESSELVEALAQQTARAAGGLPLLQFALARLWEERDQPRSLISAQALAEVGGVEGALARHADDVLERLLPGQRTAARRVLPQLVTLELTRARRTDEELGAGDDPDVRAALDALVRGRLLVASESAEGAAYEVAHEALIRGWPTLRGWLEADRDQRALRQRLAQGLAEWERLGRTREGLWSARQLAEAVPLREGELNTKERHFLAASRRAVEGRRRRRAGLAAGFVVTLAATFGGLRWQARDELHRRAEAQLARAAHLTEEAARVRASWERTRAEAFAHFDAQRPDEGERRWEAALPQGERASKLLASATAELEAALGLGVRASEVRERLAEALFLRAEVAEAAHRTTARDELLARLAVYDDRGTWRQAWARPAQLTLSLQPSSARVTVQRGADPPQGVPSGAVELEAGDLVLEASAPGRSTVRLPLRLGRGEQLGLTLALPAEGAVPDGWVYVPPGRFLFGAEVDESMRRDFFHAAPLHGVTTPGYLIGQREVTWGQWLAYLDALPVGERAGQTPAVGKGGFQGFLTLTHDGQAWALALQPTTVALQARAGERVRYPARATHQSHDWLRFPVAGVTRAQAQAYARWLAGSVPGARLCSDLEWERAAKGADERAYPHGDHLERDDANFDETYGKVPEVMGPDEVGTHLASRSPYGVDDLSGNVWEWTRSSLEPDAWVVRGGSYYFGRNSAKTFNRESVESTFVDLTVGLRVCADAPQGFPADPIGRKTPDPAKSTEQDD